MKVIMGELFLKHSVVVVLYIVREASM